jgi:hypothetical protein
MRRLESLHLDVNQCEKDLQEFKALLDSKAELSESGDILPFFKDHHQLLGLIALTLNVKASDLEFCYAFEYELIGDFRVDLIVGNRESKTYRFIEFEDARVNSLFYRGKRAIPEWGGRFLRGFGQLMDWFWKRSEEAASADFRRQFGEPPHNISGVLYVGRSLQIRLEEKARLDWLNAKVIIDSQHVLCFTFDQLYRDLRHMINAYQGIANQIEYAKSNGKS